METLLPNSSICHFHFGNHWFPAHIYATAPANVWTAIAGNNVAATLRYGHDSTLLPFAAALGLEDFSRIHSVDNLSIDYWDNASMIGMCSNVQIVFYKNKNNDILVKFLYNEKETTVPALEPEYGGVYYSWDKLREYYLSRIR